MNRREMGRTAESDPVAQLSLPPGFRFFPTDEELLVHYLCRKAAGQHFSLQLIGDIDLYKFDPWVLPSKALFGEKEWYFFSPRDRKYPNGSRPNRVAGSGYWKATGTDKIITTHGKKVGIKKALVFYIGKAPKGIKTNWIMHEYRLSDPARKKGSIRLDDWVLCRIYKKNSSSQKQSPPAKEDNAAALDVLDYLPEIDDYLLPLPRMNSIKSLQDEKFSFQSVAPGAGKMDWFSAPAFPTVPSIGQVDSHSEIPGSSIEEEVESSLISQQMEDNKNNINACFFQQSLSPFSFDPFSGSTGYSMHPACFGQGQ